MEIFARCDKDNLVIVENNDARQLSIYVPFKSSIDTIAETRCGEVLVVKKYRSVRKKIKEVKFSDFRKRNPTLSNYGTAEEQIVSQRKCY